MSKIETHNKCVCVCVCYYGVLQTGTTWRDETEEVDKVRVRYKRDTEKDMKSLLLHEVERKPDKGTRSKA